MLMLDFELDSICFYLIYNDRFSLMTAEEALDLQIMQKILPRIHGNNSAVKKVIIEPIVLSYREYFEQSRICRWRKGYRTSLVKTR